MKKLLIQGFAVNRSKIQRSNESGKDVIILKDTLACRGDSVMNRLLYPESFISNHYAELEGTLAPIGHPKRADGSLVPSTDPLAINDFHAGAWNRNARLTGNNEVLIDIYIDEKYAANSEKGRALLKRIEEVESGKVPHLWTSTGLYYEADNTSGMTANGVQYDAVITNGRFEHNAILLDELPAGGDTGFTINSESVVVARLDETHDLRSKPSKIAAFFGLSGNARSHEEINRLISDALSAKYPDQYVYPTHIYDDHFIYNYSGRIHKRSYAIGANNELSIGEPVEVSIEFKEIVTNSKVNEVNEEQVKALIANAVEQSEAKTADRLSALEQENKSLKEQLAANTDALLKEQREAVMAKFGLSAEDVSALTGNALTALYAKTQTATVATGGIAANADDALYVDYNALIDAAEAK